jgi:hypothetical protein
MRLSSRPLQGDPISSKTRRVAALLAREKTGEILARLRSRPYLAASELARLEDIHVATAQRYLQELVETDLVGVRVRKGNTRPTQEYWVREPRIRIDIDLEGTPALGEDELLEVAKRLGVRDAGNPQVVYDTHPQTKIIQGVLILSDRPPRLVSRRLAVSTNIGRFLSRLPGREDDPRGVWDVMTEAGLGVADVPSILACLGRFSNPDQSRPEGGEPGSARPLDPETRRVFEELAFREAPVDGPEVTVVEVGLLPSGSAPIGRGTGGPKATMTATAGGGR